MIRFLFLIFLLALASGRATAQVVTAGPDSAVVATPASAASVAPDTAGLSRPAKAALWGLIPGGGQVYNRDYWKVPVVYAALGGLMYSVLFANKRFNEFDRAYLYRTDGDAATVDTNPRTINYPFTPSGDNNVKLSREFYRRNRDLSVIFTAVAYGLSIAEALVDAHMASFSVSDDLSMRLAPTVVPVGSVGLAPGIGLTFSTRR